MVVIWGFNFALMKLMYRYFHPIAFNAIRFVISSVTMLAILKLRGENTQIDRKDLRGILWLGFLGNTLYPFIFVLRLDRTKAGNAALLTALTPVFAFERRHSDRNHSVIYRCCSDRALRNERVVHHRFLAGKSIDDCCRCLLGMAERRIHTPSSKLWTNTTNGSRDGRWQHCHGAVIDAVVIHSKLARCSCHRMDRPGLLRFAFDHVFIFRVGLRNKRHRRCPHLGVQQRYSHRGVIRWMASTRRKARNGTARGRGIGVDRSFHGALTQTDCSSGGMTFVSFVFPRAKSSGHLGAFGVFCPTVRSITNY